MSPSVRWMGKQGSGGWSVDVGAAEEGPSWYAELRDYKQNCSFLCSSRTCIALQNKN